MTTDMMAPSGYASDGQLELRGRLDGLIAAALYALDEALALAALTSSTPVFDRGRRVRIERALSELRRALVPDDPLATGSVALRGTELRSDGSLVKLTGAETALLGLLMREAGNTVSHNHIARAQWREAIADRYRRSAIRTTVYTLRRKMRAAGLELEIESVRGFGYRLSRAT